MLVDIEGPLSLLKKNRERDFGLEVEFALLAWDGWRFILDISRVAAVCLSLYRNEG
jgi:hypothetical protein